MNARRTQHRRTSVADDGHETVQRVQVYLARFGYLNGRFTRSVLDTPTREALMAFQRRRHVSEQGEIGPETLHEMERPVCGTPDSSPRALADAIASIPRDCSFKEAKDLAYAFNGQVKPVGLTPMQVGIEVDAAFKKWSRAIRELQIGFRQVLASESHIFELGWFKRKHSVGTTDCIPFDGPGPVVGHAFHRKGCVDQEELASQCHFDGDETWGLSAVGKVIDFPTVALHEIGHLLGLPHSGFRGAVMFETYPGTERRELTQDDIAAVRRLYGLPVTHLELLVHLEGLEVRSFGEDQFTESDEGPRMIRGFGLRFADPIDGLRLRYMAHIDNADSDSVDEGHFISGRDPMQPAFISGFAVELVGPQSDTYNVFYRAKIREIGDTALHKNGEFCGHRSLSKPIEAILVRVEPR